MHTQFRRSALMAVCVLASRVLGCVRDAAFAWFVGSGALADALVAALRLPFLARRLYNDGTFSLELTTACVRERLRFGGSGVRFALYAGAWMFGGALALTSLLFVAAPLVLRLLAPGLEAANPLYTQALGLFRLALPYIVLVCVAAAAMAAAASREVFVLPALSPAIFNMVVLAGLASAFAWQGSAVFVVACVLAGGLAVVLFLTPLCVWLWRDESGPASPARAARSALGLPLGLLAGAGPQLVFIAAAALASLSAQGSLAAMFYAERLVEFPLGFLSAVGGMLAAPILTRSLCEEGDRAMALRLGLYARLSLGLGLAAGAGLCALAWPLARLVYGHGIMQEADLARIAMALAALSPAVPACALARVALAACHARHDTKTPVISLTIAMPVALGSGFVLLSFLGAFGAALGASVALWVYALVLWRGARRGLEAFMGRKAIGAYALGAAFIWGWSFWALRVFGVFGGLAAAVVGGLCVYTLVLLLAEPDLRGYVRAWMRGSSLRRG